jgi:shikimate dehydrogenase
MVTTNVKYNTKTQILGILGFPLDHSVTSIVHNAMYQYGNINAIFYPLEIENKPGNLDRFFEAFKTLKMKGFSVTMPYKTMMLPYLDEAPEVCRRYNCINNVKYEDGKFYGDSFDGYAICETFERAGCYLKGKRALILGAGGITGVTLDEMNKRGVTSFTILNRTIKRAETIAAALCEQSGKSVHVGPLTPEELNRAAKESDVVAQCTSLGMHGSTADFEYLNFVKYLPDKAMVVDAIYNPLQTSILRAASNRGLVTKNGVEVLANQMTKLIMFYFGVDLGEGGRHEAIATTIYAMQLREHGLL